jgi:hypothetical protein
MKRVLFLFAATIMTVSLSSQEANKPGQSKFFQKIVLDIGAIPFSTSFGNPRMTGYNFTLGYQVIKRLDVRFNLDVYNYYDKNREPNYPLHYDEKLIGLSIGLGYVAFKGKDNSFLNHKSISFIGKFGAGISPEDSTQQTLFFDLAARVHLGIIPYISFGFTDQMYFSEIDPDLKSLYISFGIDF